jgi:hypothetical protein
MSKEKGYVYILINPSFREDWVKIGKSARTVDVRSKELDNTAVPLPFEIYATLKTAKYNEVEKQIHRQIDLLTDLRIRQNREFFNVKPQVALEILKDISKLLDDAELEEIYLQNKQYIDCENEEFNLKTRIEKPKSTINEMKIGEFVQYCFREAFKQNLISKEEIDNLQDKNYSKLVFKQRFEILRQKDKDITDDLGRKRYYKELFCGDFHLTSQWFEYHWEPFKQWLNKMNFDYAK